MGAQSGHDYCLAPLREIVFVSSARLVDQPVASEPPQDPGNHPGALVGEEGTDKLVLESIDVELTTGEYLEELLVFFIGEVASLMYERPSCSTVLATFPSFFIPSLGSSS